jgi:hypothetical protein
MQQYLQSDAKTSSMMPLSQSKHDPKRRWCGHVVMSCLAKMPISLKNRNAMTKGKSQKKSAVHSIAQEETDAGV